MVPKAHNKAVNCTERVRQAFTYGACGFVLATIATNILPTRLIRHQFNVRDAAGSLVV